VDCREVKDSSTKKKVAWKGWLPLACEVALSESPEAECSKGGCKNEKGTSEGEEEIDINRGHRNWAIGRPINSKETGAAGVV